MTSDMISRRELVAGVHRATATLCDTTQRVLSHLVRSARSTYGAAAGLLLLVALCSAPAGTAPLGAQTPGARAILPGIDTPILLDTLGIAFPIRGQRDSIFAALEVVFGDLKIPVETRDPKTGMLRNLDAQVSRRLGSEPLSRYLDCGRGFSGSNADIYRIQLAISVWVEPATGEAERLLVAIAASGRDPSGSRSAYSACTSRGALERRISELVQARVKQP